MIEVKDLTKIYGGLTAIENVSFAVDKGEILGLLGPNGAGKTTTMRILAGSLGATRGSAAIAGFEVHENPREVKRRLGYMPEVPPLYTSMTVQAYLRFAASIKGVPRSKRKAAVDRAVELCGLGKSHRRIIGQLSKGYRQRVGLAQAVVHEPEILILDEPTSGLDPAQISDVRRLIKGLGGEHTVILSTHILPEVTMTCDRVAIIDRGHIIAEDSEQGLADRVLAERQMVVQVAEPGDACAAALAAVDGVQGVEPGDDGVYRLLVGESDPRLAVSQAVVSGGFGLLEQRLQSATLEEIYLRLVGAGMASAVTDEASVNPLAPAAPATDGETEVTA
jgi:ABC-2 type transport system ATP-binding protein